VKHNYQTIDTAASALGAPSSVTVAIGEVIADVREGLLAMAVGTGLQVMAAMFEDDVAATCGPKGKHDPDRVAVRHGSERGSVSLGGRQVPISRPRMRAMDGSGELPLPSYELFSNTEVLGRLAMGKMLAGISTRGWHAGLEPVGEQVDQAATGTSKSAISRRFVKATETALTELLARRLDDLDLVALMIDGVHFGEHLCVVALGIGIDGIKHPLAVVEGDTENTTVVTGLLVGLRERGLDTSKPILVVLDGAKALKAAVTRVFDHPVIARCQQHKIENVKNRLPERLKSVVEKRMRRAYHAESALAAEAQLEALAKELERTHPGAAASLREGLPETLTTLRLKVPPTLARTLRSTNSIESMISIARTHSRNVKHWQGGQMALRWCAAGIAEAGKQFRRVNGHMHLAALRRTLDEHVAAQTVAAVRQDDNVIAA
jgi:putative transposase